LSAERFLETNGWAKASPLAARGLGLAAVASALGYYICSGMPQIGDDVFARTLALQAVTFALAVGYGAYLLAQRRLPGGSPLDWPLTALLGVYFLATLTSSSRQVSLESTLMLVMAVLLFYILSDLRFLGTWTLQRGLMLAGAVASFWALWNVAGDYGDWLEFARAARGGFHLGDLIPPTVPKVHGVSDHPNILGMVLTLIIPFYTLAVYRAPLAWERFVWGVALLAAAWAVFLTLSRGAWVGAATGAGVTILAMAVHAAGEKRRLEGRIRLLSGALRRRSILIIAAGLALAAAFLIVAVLILARWESRPQWLFRESLSPRQDVFSSGVEMFLDSPLLGRGPGTFALLYPEYSGKYPIHAVHAHNGPLQTAVDAGVLGLLALVFLGGVTLWMLVRTYRRGSNSEKLIAIASGGALLGFAAHNMADAGNTWKAPLIALAAVLAIVAVSYRGGEGDGSVKPAKGPEGRRPLLQRLPVVVRVLLALAMVALFLLWGRIDVAHYHYSESLASLERGQKLEAVREGREAVSCDGELAIYQLQLGLTEVLAFLDDGPDSLLQQAIEHLQQGVELEPYGAIGHANLARALALAQRYDEARAEALEAQRLAGADPTVLLAAATVLEEIGAEDDAVETYAMAVTRMASVADSDFWTTSEFRSEHYEEIIDRSALSLNPCGKGRVLVQMSEENLALPLDTAELTESCAFFILGNPNDIEARVDFGELLMGLGEYDAAFEHLSFAVERQPDFGRGRTALGKWYAHEGDPERARQEWILGSQLGDTESLVLLGNTYPPGEVPEKLITRLEGLEPTWAGPVRYYSIGYVYYRMKFARQSSPVTLLPGDWQTALPREYSITKEALERWRAPP
jgi:O-antigen ligase